MQKSLTAVGSALTALQGLSADGPTLDAGMRMRLAQDADYAVVLSLSLNDGVHNMYARHRSHSSHSSHRSHSSHSSHYSGSGGYRYTPATPAPAIAPSAPPPASREGSAAPAPLYSSPANKRPTADQLRMIIMRVQAALYSKGYDPGAIDGVLSPATVAALRRFQVAKGLAASGTLTTETLDALGISAAP